MRIVLDTAMPTILATTMHHSIVDLFAVTIFCPAHVMCHRIQPKKANKRIEFSNLSWNMLALKKKNYRIILIIYNTTRLTLFCKGVPERAHRWIPVRAKAAWEVWLLRDLIKWASSSTTLHQHTECNTDMDAPALIINTEISLDWHFLMIKQDAVLHSAPNTYHCFRH